MLIKKALFSILFIIIGWIFCNIYQRMKEEKATPEVTTIGVTQGRITESILLKLKVEGEVVENLTSATNSRVEQIFVKVGDYVKKGDLLIQLYQDDLINELSETELRLDKEREKEALLKQISFHPKVIESDEECSKVEDELKQAMKELGDANELYARKALTYRDVEKWASEVKRVEMSKNRLIRERNTLIKSLEKERKEVLITTSSIITKVNELRMQIAGCKIYASINGVVTEIPIRRNQKVEYGNLLLIISTIDELVGKGGLSEQNFFLVREGQQANIASEVMGKRFTGKVLQVSSFAKETGGAGGGVWEVTVGIDNPTGLRVGMELSCEITVKEQGKDSIIIPPEALYEEDGVLVVEHGRIRKRKVEIGESTVNQIEVLAGLKPGDKVVVSYPEEIKEGMRVTERGG